ncbi:hypothetical protein Neuguinea42_02270 [Helicobacter pylori]
MAWRLEANEKKIVYVEGESDKIFLILLNKVKNLEIDDGDIVICESNIKLFKKAREY